LFSLGLDVSLKAHRCALLDSEGEKAGSSFSVDSSPEGFETLLATLKQRGVSSDQVIAGLEATGHLWENLFAFLERHKIKVVLLNPFQTQRYRELLSKKAKTDDIDLITSIPGVGPKTAAVLIAEIGDVSRFQSANHLVGYFGFFPQIRESGGKMLGTPRISPRGPKHFRKALYMAAVASLKHNREMRSVYDRYQTMYEPGRFCLSPV
jgi:transposase